MAADVFAWLAFLGAWCLVAGPVYQAALELRAEEDARAVLATTDQRVPPPAHVSAWWWLLPPVRYVKEARRQAAYRRAVADALAPEELRAVVRYLEKVGAWLLVAAGGSLLAVAETWALRVREAWPAWTFWVATAVMAAVALGNTPVRLRRTRDMLASRETGLRRPPRP